MQTITVEHTVSCGHRLPSYDGICKNLHGHNLRVELEVVVEAFLDFKRVGAELKAYLHSWDHAMILYDQDPFALLIGNKHMKVFYTKQEPTTEHLCELLMEYMSKQFKVKRITVHETGRYSATLYTS